MVNETRKKVKFNDLSKEARANCIEQYFGCIAWDDMDLNDAIYKGWENEGKPTERDYFGVDLFVEATPDQFYFDENGDWYDEGRKVK